MQTAVAFNSPAVAGGLGHPPLQPNYFGSTEAHVLPMKTVLVFCLVSRAVAAACGWLSSVTTPTPPLWIGDAFFFGEAFVDVNSNGEIDSADTPLQRAVFIARDARGAEFGDFTDADGRATVEYPGGAVYPVILRMKPPEGSNLVLIVPTEVVLKDAAGSSAKFLFAKQPVTPSR